EHRGDVWMDNPRRVRRFTRKPLRGIGAVEQRAVHHLDGAVPIHFDVLGEIDLYHPTFTEPLQNAITIREDASDDAVGGPLGSQRRSAMPAYRRSGVL